MADICLLTSGQPSTDPRLVKEADALVDDGHQVRVVAMNRVPWAGALDAKLLPLKQWTCEYVGGSPTHHSLQHHWTRIRHGLIKRIFSRHDGTEYVRTRALSRAQPELEDAARETRADIYIGHGIGGLQAAVRGAQTWGTHAACDLEDFLPGMRTLPEPLSPLDVLTTLVERKCLPQCAYTTAASPGIARAYADQYGIPMPTTILNVFPLSDRPATMRRGEREGPLRLYWFSQTIGPARGIEDAVRAVALLPESAVEIHLRGAWQPEYREHIYALASSLGVRSSCIVEHAPASPDDMVGLASAFDVGLALECLVSENRAICLTNKIFTYLLAGNAIAATATPAQSALMSEIPGAGIVYEPGNSGALAQTLDTWRRDPSALTHARQCAWDWGTSRFNWEVERATFLNVVNDVLTVSARSLVRHIEA